MLVACQKCSAGDFGKRSVMCNIGDIDVIFRDGEDYNGNNKIAISERWYVWRINENFRYVGKLESNDRNAEIDIVKALKEIIERMKTGKYSYYYPGFE